jgi:hypothetical protein
MSKPVFVPPSGGGVIFVVPFQDGRGSTYQRLRSDGRVDLAGPGSRETEIVD